jgi:hypothetical protein
MRDRPGFRTGFSVIASMAITCDLLVEGALQALQSAWPGIGTPTALPYLAKDKGFVCGPMQSDDALARLLRRALGIHRTSGNAYSISLVVASYLGNDVPVWTVNRAGTWTRLILGTTPQTWAWSVPGWEPESTVSLWDVGSYWIWDWDSISNPERSQWALDVWMAAQDPRLDAGTWGDDASVWGEDGAFGHGWTSDDKDALSMLIRKWTPPHCYLDTFIWYTNPDFFDAIGIPDGTWGSWAIDDGTGHWVASRDLTCRYWHWRN